MERARSEGVEHAEQSSEPIAGNITPFPMERVRRPEPPPSDAELAEYRRIRPQLLQMLAEWQKIRSMCPLATRLVSEGD